ncbi:hypothetical protein CRM90_28000 [Mycobacterium sp. ENV421]|uniref:hypothetical protein n=1 Tax=Mycobacterium sp. ENV421 TaxID=1213407 RepID=UPI000C9B0540|nr:hypothetical protein [Mycobacterium sp. ENV421]PND54445.1 hypothetical protein CRM90_28000 [Mycobacterium sp. ENV421]
MTDNDTTTETTEIDLTETEAIETEHTADAPEDTDQPAEDKPTNREAKYRVQLRETEAQRDQLAATVEAMQRAEVERLAAEHLTKPAALWTAGVELTSLVGDDGTIDPDLVLAAAQDARQQLGLENPRAAKLRGPVVPREGTSVQSGGNSGSWADAFKV